MGMSEGLVRYSVGLDNDMEMIFQKIEEALRETWTTVRDSGMPFYFRL